MSETETIIKEEVTIKFAGDSGDGMQLTGKLFTENTALAGNDLATFPDFPSEIRAPTGTVWGVSGFQVHFGSRKINTPGDQYDVLVAMNAAAFKSNLSMVKRIGATIIINTDGFDSRNLRLAEYENADSPFAHIPLEGYELLKIPVTKLTKEALADSTLGRKDQERCKNMFVLGYLLWKYNRRLDNSILFLEEKFKHKPDLLVANRKVLKAGFYFGETNESFTSRYQVDEADLPQGRYRGITGTESLVFGLVTASHKSKLPLYYASYPITPASDILHNLVALEDYGVKTFQAEDEIAAICSAIGAAYGGSLGITGTSGPGLALKTEAMGLAAMLELPLVILNIQRGGPSTGLPTKTEQADLLMALYGRNGECPIPVLAVPNPSEAFYIAYEACKIAVEHMTPVIVLSDGYINNGAVPWKIPNPDELPPIQVKFAVAPENGIDYLPYKRDVNGVRPWAIPGTPGLMHQIGGLEKEDGTGSVSYDPDNHQLMVKARQAKVDTIADFVPDQKIESGPESGDVLVLGWGSTHGVIESAVQQLLSEGHKIAHAHLRHIAPLPNKLGTILNAYKKVIIPEVNNGQLVKIIKDKFLLPVIPFSQIKGMPIFKDELVSFITKHLS